MAKTPPPDWHVTLNGKSITKHLYGGVRSPSLVREGDLPPWNIELELRACEDVDVVMKDLSGEKDCSIFIPEIHLRKRATLVDYVPLSHTVGRAKIAVARFVENGLE